MQSPLKAVGRSLLCHRTTVTHHHYSELLRCHLLSRRLYLNIFMPWIQFSSLPFSSSSLLKSLQSSPLCDSLWLSQLEMQRKLCLNFSVRMHSCAFLPGLHSSPGKKKQCFSLKSDPAFYRVELLIADNPAAPPTLCLGLTPSHLLLPSCPRLLFSVFTSPPFRFPCIVSLFLLSPSFPSSPPSFATLLHKRAGILRRCLSDPPPLCVAPCCVVLVGTVGGVVLSLVVPIKQIMCWFWRRRLVIPLNQQSRSISPLLLFWKQTLSCAKRDTTSSSCTYANPANRLTACRYTIKQTDGPHLIDSLLVLWNSDAELVYLNSWRSIQLEFKLFLVQVRQCPFSGKTQLWQYKEVLVMWCFSFLSN